jgi:DNA-binding NarL/FixJ family response regulator
MTLRVLVIADQLLARAGLAALLADQSGIQVVGQVAADESLADDLDVYRPDALVWDFGWTAKTAQERLSALIDELEPEPLLPVLILVPDASAGDTAALLRSAAAGGLLPRDAPPEQLAAALNAIAQGLLVFDPALALLPSGEPVPDAPAPQLTPRELEVLHLLAEGLANKAIAQRLGISDHTVKFHVNALMSKLDAQSRTDAVVRATRLGLILL